MLSPNRLSGPYLIVRDADGNLTDLRQDSQGTIFDPSKLDENGVAKKLTQAQIDKALGKKAEVQQTDDQANTPVGGSEQK